MKHIFTRYKLNIIKEESKLYDINNQIANPQDIYNVLKDVVKLSNEAEEVLILITLNSKNVISGVFEVARGSINSAVIHPREVFKRALMNNASSIVIAHNHPSGDYSPSKEDIGITRRIKECGKLMGIELLDHIIIGDGYASLKEKGVI